MLEKLSLNEARHILSDFFEIHSENPQKHSLMRAIQILDDMDEARNEDEVFLSTLPTIRVGGSLLSYLPENYNPDQIYLVHGKSKKKGYSKKIRVR